MSEAVTTEPTLGRRALVVVGLLAYLAAGFIYLTSGLVVPAPWIFILWGLWLVGMWVVARLVARWSWWTLAAGPLAFGFWWAYLAVGESLLGWTA